ncbi:MAG: class I SAM-dependent methyltransferase [Chloroflexia bacterium]
MLPRDSWELEQVRERRLLLNRLDTWLFEEVKPFIGERVLEVGCGYGNLTQHLLSRQLVVGIDISPSSITTFQQRFFDQPRVHGFVCDITDPNVLELASWHFDTAIALNVLEHIEQEEQALEHIFQLLQPGGHFIVIVPALPELYGSMDGSIGHFRRYTAESLRQRLEQKFSVHRLRYYNLLGIIGWWLNGKVLRRRVPPQGQLQLFNLLVPLIQTVERHIRIPVGLSLVAVARKDIP